MQGYIFSVMFRNKIVLLLLFSILWGEKKLVNIRFAGNTEFSEWDLLSAMDISKPQWYHGIFGHYPALNEYKLQASLELIKSMYIDHGFLDVRTDYRLEPAGKDTQKVVLVILIDSGQRYYVDTVKVVVPREFNYDSVRTRIGFKTGDIFSPYRAEKYRQKVQRWFADRGYPYATVDMKWEKDSLSHKINIKYSVHPGKKAYWGKISYKGLRRTKPYLVERELAIKTGEPYSQTQLEQTRENLYSTGLFRIVSVELPRFSQQPETIDVIISLVENKRGWYGFSINLGANKEYDFTTELSAEWGHKNIFGSGKNIALRANLQTEMIRRWQIVSHRYEFKFSEPWTFGQKIPTTLTAYFEPGVKTEQHPYRVQKAGINLGFFKKLKVVSHSGGITYEKTDIYGVPESEAEEIKNEQGIVVSRKINYIYQRDVRDDPLMPTSGSLITFGVDMVGGLLGGDQHYLKVNTKWSSYTSIPFLRHAILADRFQLTVMGTTRKNADISIHNRLATGGAYSVRGFDELSIGPKTQDSLHTMLGGKVLFLFSVELRYRIVGRLWGHTFLDAGQVWYEWKDINPRDIRASTGAGLAFMTPIGPLRLDYGIILLRQEYDPPRFSGRWHLAFLYAY